MDSGILTYRISAEPRKAGAQKATLFAQLATPALLAVVIIADNVPKYLAAGRPAFLGAETMAHNPIYGQFALLGALAISAIATFYALIQNIYYRTTNLATFGPLLYLASFLLTYIFAPNNANAKGLLLTSIVVLPLIFSRTTLSRLHQIVFVTPLFALLAASLLFYILFPELAITNSRLEGEASRYAGVFSHANVLAIFAALGVPYALILDGKLRITLLALSVLTLFATDSRTSLIALIVAFGLGLIARAIVGGRPLNRAVAPLLSVGAVILSFLIAKRSLSVDYSLSGRQEIWRYIFDNWSQSPILGSGTSGLSAQIQLDSSLPIYSSHAHNIPLHMVYNFGLIGVIAFLALILSLTNRPQLTLTSKFDFVRLVALTAILSTTATEVVYLPSINAETALVFALTFGAFTFSGAREGKTLE